jgi:hypothetical protein
VIDDTSKVADHTTMLLGHFAKKHTANRNKASAPCEYANLTNQGDRDSPLSFAIERPPKRERQTFANAST